MQDSEWQLRASQLVERHFFEDGRLVSLRAGETLVHEGEPNRRLYCIRKGRIAGYQKQGDGTSKQVLEAGPGDLVGVQSFFTALPGSAVTLIASEDSELGYIEEDWPMPTDHSSMAEKLIPVVVNELVRRQRMFQQIAQQEEQVRQRMDALQKMSALGQLAAGVAHELNNATAVLARGAEWIGEAVDRLVAGFEPDEYATFHRSFRFGRDMSSEQVRQRSNELRSKYGLSVGEARRLAKIDVDEALLKDKKSLLARLPRLIELWEVGATLHDMIEAAHQAEHVVESMKQLGGSETLRDQPIDVNESIRVALQILRNVTKGIEVELSLGELPMVHGNRGELVQIWTNLIKNACDALHSVCGAKHEAKLLKIRSWCRGGDVHVEIADNGPGIPTAILPRIFEPDVTTKKKGLSFGLGLGLAIVQRLVTDYGGHVEARNTERGATFAVSLPQGV